MVHVPVNDQHPWHVVSVLGVASGDHHVGVDTKSQTTIGDGWPSEDIGWDGWHFTDPRQLVASSELVVLGRVERVERGPASPQGDAVETIRYLHVKVEQRLYGRLSGDQVVLQDQGWLKIDGQPEKPFRLEGMIRLEAGDRAFLFLHKDPDTGFYEQLDDQAAYRIQGGEIIDSQRTDPMVRRIELMRDRDLVQLVTDTAAAIRRGEIKPARPRSSG